MVRDGSQVAGRRASADDSHIRTFLIADVRGYTVFTQENGDEAAAALAGKFAVVAREGVEARGGTVVELRGDEALAVFDSARQAIRAAVELQRRFVDATVAEPTLPLAVGIGLDAGEAVAVEGGYRGGALNLAARLCGIAAPAEILASPAVTHLARKVEGVAYVDRGTVNLKGLADPVQVIRLRAEANDAADDMAFRRALGSRAARLTPAVPGAIVANPYKGLRAFEEGDAPDFFGREELVEQLIKRLGQTRFLAVVGPSGSGKSSVVRAGLIPAIRRGAIPASEGWRIADMFPGDHPLDGLEAALLRAAPDPPPSLMEQLERDERGLHRAVLRLLPTDGSELVLVIDQFEEVFTLVEDEAVRTHFLGSLEAAVRDPHSRLRVVATLRADFYDRPLLYRGFAKLFKSRVEAVIPLSAEELERAISGPAKRVDVSLEPGLVAAMLADVAEEPGALPLMEYALTELFERRDGRVLFLEAYREIGGVSGALGRRAEELFAELDDKGREAARQLFLRLVALGEGTEDTRRRVPRSDVASLDVDQHAMTIVLDTFGASRQLSFDRDPGTGAPTIELAHEAMLTAWPRLHRWIDEAREDLRTERRLALATHEWLDSDRDSSFLVSGSRLDQFETWRHSAGISITPEERDFLEASLAERDRRRTEDEARQARERALERRSITRLRALVAVLAAASLIASGVIVFALDQRERAELGERVAVAREIAAAAGANLEVDAERSILLALEAVEQTRSVDGSVLPEVLEALHRAVVASRIVLSVPGLGGWLDWSPDGRRFVTEGPEESGSVDIRDADTGESLLSFHGHDPDVNGVAFSPDGSMLATTGDDGAIRVWDPESGERLGNFQGPDGPVSGPSFSPDGSLVAAAWIFEDKVMVWDLASGRRVHTIDSVGEAWATSFSPDGRLGIAGFDPPVAVVVDVVSGKEEFTLRGSGFAVADIDWSPDGRWIATSSDDSTIRIWEAQTGNPRFTLFGHTGPVSHADWSPDSGRLVTGSADGTAKVWEISEGGAREMLSLSAQGTRSGLQGVAFSPDGDRVMTGDLEISAVKIWDVSLTGDAEWANLPARSDSPTSVAFTPDGGLVASSRDGSVNVWDPETGRRLQTIGRRRPSGRPDGAFIEAIDISPDGALIAATNSEGRALVWDTATGEEAFNVRASGGVEDIAWSPDGALLAIAFDEGFAEVVDRTGKRVTVLREPGFHVASVRFSPDGRLLATAGLPMGRPDFSAQHVTIWDWVRGEVVMTIMTQVDRLAFDPGGARIAIASQGGAEIWNLESGQKDKTLTGHTGPVLDVAFSPDGSRIATVGLDATARLWDAKSGVQVLVLRGHGSVVGDVAFSPDGTKLATGGGDESVRVWALDLDDLIEIANGELTRGLIDEECRQYLHLEACP